MLRIALFPFLIIILILLSIILIWYLYRKVKKGINYTVKKGTEIANDQQQKWTEKEQRKKHPEILQKGFSDYEQINQLTKSLPDNWRISLIPLVDKSKEILDEISLEFSNDDQSNLVKEQNKKLNGIRSFFNHSLDALLQFVEKLTSDYKKMNDDEVKKAHQNIEVFKADLLNHQETLHKARRFEFDVAMDVIKARLKK